MFGRYSTNLGSRGRFRYVGGSHIITWEAWVLAGRETLEHIGDGEQVHIPMAETNPLLPEASVGLST